MSSVLEQASQCVYTGWVSRKELRLTICRLSLLLFDSVLPYLDQVLSKFSIPVCNMKGFFFFRDFRISCRVVVLLKALLKLICDVARDTSLTTEATKSTLLQEATDCLILLDHCSQGQVKVRQESASRFQWASCLGNHD